MAISFRQFLDLKRFLFMSVPCLDLAVKGRKRPFGCLYKNKRLKNTSSLATEAGALKRHDAI
jgi:hypothetical protein